MIGAGASAQHRCIGKLPLCCHLSNHDRWTAAHDWALWTVPTANALVLSYSPCAGPIFPLFLKTPSPPLLQPFSHLFYFIFLTLLFTS